MPVPLSPKRGFHLATSNLGPDRQPIGHNTPSQPFPVAQFQIPNSYPPFLPNTALFPPGYPYPFWTPKGFYPPARIFTGFFYGVTPPSGFFFAALEIRLSLSVHNQGCVSHPFRPPDQGPMTGSGIKCLRTMPPGQKGPVRNRRKPFLLFLFSFVPRVPPLYPFLVTARRRT